MSNSNYIKVFENKFSFDQNYKTKIDDNLSVKFKHKRKDDNSSNKTLKRLNDARNKITAYIDSKANESKTSIHACFINLLTRQIYIKGINLLNNLIKIPSKIIEI